MADPLSPPPTSGRVADALPPYLANGIVGIRLPGAPHLPGVTMVNGFAGLHPADGVEGFARAPHALAVDVRLGGVWASSAPEWVEQTGQRYDFSVGEVHTAWRFRVGGTTAEVETVAFCSRTIPAIAALEVTVRTDEIDDLEIAVGVDPTGAPGFATDLAQPQDQGPNEGVDGRLRWHSHGDLSCLGIAYATKPMGDAAAERSMSTSDARGWLSTSWSFRARAGRRYGAQLLTALVPDLSHARPDEQAGRLAASGASLGFESLRDANRAAWRQLWRSRIEIDGADARWQAITDASVFYLATSVHASSLASTSLFGLAYWPDYHYYHGHVMWDIETFTVPPLLLLAPDAAHALLDYRFRNLTAARHHAALHGHRGAMYPWESCPQHGEESTPGARPYTEDHVTLDVALAFASYVHATGDIDYARRVAWPVLRSVADWVTSRVERTRRGYEIRRTVGPRESYEPVDNNAFTNMAATRTLEEAVACAELIGNDAPAAWVDIAKRLVLPRGRRGAVIVNHDGARLDEPQGGVPEGAAGLFPLGYRATAVRELATYRYAALEQAPRYVGAPMLSALLGVFASRAGEPDLAMELLERGYGDFITGPFTEPSEFPASQRDKPQASPMFANLSGYLTGLLYGFTGIRLNSDAPHTWSDRPVTLPAGWRGIEVETVWVRGAPYRLSARSGSKAVLEPHGG
jgi:protein-glucosylgalactosylhydroxylysine glucosidase